MEGEKARLRHLSSFAGQLIIVDVILNLSSYGCSSAASYNNKVLVYLLIITSVDLLEAAIVS